MGAAAVGFAWLFVGGNSSNDLAQSLGQAPGIPPPDYAYLDNARVALYLGQLQGGLARSEQLSEQLTQGRNAGLSAGGVSVGGSAGSSASRERVVTPTATARFYQLLDLLDRDGYLHRIDVSASPKMLVREFAQVPEGTFVQLHRCRLRIPSYIQLAQLSFGSSGYYSASIAYGASVKGSRSTNAARGVALVRAGREKFTCPTPPPRLASGRGTDRARLETPGSRRQAEPARAVFDLRRPPCREAARRRPAVPRPPRCALVRADTPLRAGHDRRQARSLRRPRPGYVDQPSLAAFENATRAVDTPHPTARLSSRAGSRGELASDATVLAPGAVILPIAIYK